MLLSVYMFTLGINRDQRKINFAFAEKEPSRQTQGDEPPRKFFHVLIFFTFEHRLSLLWKNRQARKAPEIPKSRFVSKPKHTFKLMTLKNCDPSIVVSSPTCGCIRKCFVTLSKFDKRIYTAKKVSEMRQPLLCFSFT